MKIRITNDVPLEPRHNVRLGDVYETNNDHYSSRGVYITSKANEEVLILSHEYEVITEEE